jgi:hypothetical protein
MHLLLIRFAVVPQQRIFHGVFSHLQQNLTSNWISGLNAIKPIEAALTYIDYVLYSCCTVNDDYRLIPFNVVSFHLLATSTHVMLHKRYPRKYHYRLITFLFVQNAYN